MPDCLSMNLGSRLSWKACLLLFLAAITLCENAVSDPENAGASDRFTVDALLKLGDVSDVQISPERTWVAYTVSTRNLEDDEAQSRIWMVPSDGGTAIALTSAHESSRHPRWSPDGRFIAFLSERKDKPTQVWSLYRGGGEAEQLSDTVQAVKAFEWSPDSSRLLLLLQDPSPEELEAAEKGDKTENRTPDPRVIDRQQFKTDYVGYLDRRRTHIYRLDLGSGQLSQLTFGDYDHKEASWSPDGKRIAFSANRSENPDNDFNTDIWVVPATGGEPLQITHHPGPDDSPTWSPDGRSIAHTSTADLAVPFYGTARLAVSTSDGSGTRVRTGDLDRWISRPRFSPDGAWLWFLLEERGAVNLARMRTDGDEIERVIHGEQSVSEFDFGPGNKLFVLSSRPHLPPEVYSWTENRLHRLSSVNRDMLESLQLGQVEKIHFHSPDGTAVEGFVIKPPGFTEGRRYPAILHLHGGPQSQWDWGFNPEAQLFAAAGYLVIQPNPRGSTGYGQEFCLAIWQDWGGPDYEDVIAAVDHVIEAGWADPKRLAVTGWSYGGMLTNHVITKTDRFRAAATGASATLYVANFGHDMYQRWWTRELGLPWEPEARKHYERMSPFNRIDQVVTPTLILGGEMDWNVPIINSEQLYLALKLQGVETQLVVYPGEYHGIGTPSYERDLYQRYLDWFGRYLDSH